MQRIGLNVIWEGLHLVHRGFRRLGEGGSYTHRKESYVFAKCSFW